MHAAVDHPNPERPVVQLTGTQIAVLRQLLQATLIEQKDRQQLAEDLFATVSADATLSAAERHAARRDVDDARHLIGAVERALADLDEGRYGSCRACGRGIPFERLEALPRTTTCVACS